MKLKLSSKSDKSQFGVGFIEVALILPFVIFLIMGFIDLGMVLHGRYQMQQAASLIARRLQDTPRIPLNDLNTTIGSVLAGLNGQTGTKSVGIWSYTTAPTGGWETGVAAHSRNFNAGVENYWVGVVVRMNMQPGSFMSPYVRNLVPGNNYSASSLVAVKNIQNCGTNRIMISDNNGSYRCGPNCGPLQVPMISADGQNVICGPGGSVNNFLRVTPTGGIQPVAIPVCGNQGVLQFDGVNFVCRNIGAMVGPCNQPGQVLRSNGNTIYCHNLTVQTATQTMFVTHNSVSNCRNDHACPDGSFVNLYEDQNDGGSSENCRFRCGRPVIE